jgi:hypothetical protein
MMIIIIIQNDHLIPVFFIKKGITRRTNEKTMPDKSTHNNNS